MASTITLMICTDFVTRLIPKKGENHMRKLYLSLAALAMVAALVVLLALPAAACEDCRITGGGTIGTYETRVTHGFELHCNHEQLPNRLEVNWGGNHFHLTELTLADCWNDSAIDPYPPEALCDSYYGRGVGRYNGVGGYEARWSFTDAGEPGVDDFAWIWIFDPLTDTTVLYAAGSVTRGNQQFHNLTGKDAK